MAFYRSLTAAFVALSVASVVFAADATQTTTPTSTANQQAANTTTQGTQATPVQAVGQPAANTAKINLNTATKADLMRVKGLSAHKAAAILAYRQKHGDFKSLDDLRAVKGFKKISQRRMKRIENQLTLS